MAGKMDPVMHFEIAADDTGRARQFYERAFGWQTVPLGPEARDFVLAFTMESDEKTRIPKRPGAINGGIYKRGEPEHGVKLTILVDDVHEARKKVAAAGGKLIGDVIEMPGVGRFANFLDTEGNLGTLYQDFTVKRL